MSIVHQLLLDSNEMQQKRPGYYYHFFIEHTVIAMEVRTVATPQ